MAVVDIYGGNDPRELPFYTVSQAAGYLRVPASTLRTWATGMDYPTAQGRWGRFRPVIEVPPGNPVCLTFNNLIEAYVLTTMRRVHDLSLGLVRAVIENVKTCLGDQRPLLSKEFETDGARVYLRHVEGIIDVSGDGLQLAMPQVIASLQRIERDLSGVAKLYPFVRSADEPRIVSIDPRVSFGKPTIVGTRVTVDVLASFKSAGESTKTIAQEFKLDEEQVKVAVEWHELAAA